MISYFETENLVSKTKQSQTLIQRKLQRALFSLSTSPNDAENYAHGKENDAPKHDTEESQTSQTFTTNLHNRWLSIGWLVYNNRCWLHHCWLRHCIRTCSLDLNPKLEVILVVGSLKSTYYSFTFNARNLRVSCIVYRVFSYTTLHTR